MGCPALGIWVAFFKQPYTLPGQAPPPKKNKKKLYIKFNKRPVAENVNKQCTVVKSFSKTPAIIIFAHSS
jgi:hypothetical protein